MRLSRSGLALFLAALLVLTLAPVAAASEHAAKPAVHRIPEAEWHLRDSLSGGRADTVFRYGRVNDLSPMLCDWNGDGTTSPSVRRRRDGANPVWHVRESLSAGPADHTFVYGREGDRVLCGDWNRDGRQTPGVVRRRDDGRLEWHLRNALAGGPADIVFVYGRVPGEPWVAFAGDWNGDGRDTPGIVRPREGDDRPEWHLRNALAAGPADIRFVYGSPWLLADDVVQAMLVGDWNGDGIETPGIVRARDGGRYEWHLRDRHAGGRADRVFTYGRADHLDLPQVWE